MKKIIIQMVSLFSVIILSSCLNTQERIVVYTERHYETDQVLYDKFTEETNIELDIVRASADELIARLITEGKNTPADVLIFKDAGRLYRALQESLLQPFEDDIMKNQVEEGLYGSNFHWYGLTMRARVVMYAKNRIDPSQLSTYENLADPIWQDQIAVRTSSNLYNISWIASLLMLNGEDQTQTFLDNFVGNFHRKPAGNDRDQAKLVASNVGANLAIMNTYYMGLLLNSDDESERAVGTSLGVFFPNQGENGTGAHINLSAGGIVTHANNVDGAKRFLRFLTNNDSQTHFTNVNYEYPVNPNTSWNPLLIEWGTFKRQFIDLNQLGLYHEKAFEIMIQSNWE
tara:strand:+ start:2472 stop:3503 length:1032 start_codon:yes stop_codon:yes gene_type:complete